MQNCQMPNRFRLSLSALFLAFITLFDPSIMQGMLIAWQKSKRSEDKKRKSDIIFGTYDKEEVDNNG